MDLGYYGRVLNRDDPSSFRCRVNLAPRRSEAFDRLARAFFIRDKEQPTGRGVLILVKRHFASVLNGIWPSKDTLNVPVPPYSAEVPKLNHFCASLTRR